jgi:hypothetical protein
MSNEAHQSLALEFARALSERRYAAAHAMCTRDLRSKVSVEKRGGCQVTPAACVRFLSLDQKRMPSAARKSRPPLVPGTGCGN